MTTVYSPDWGTLGGVGCLSAGVVALFTTHLVILLLPMAVQEMVMAMWLIVKGFDPVALATDDDPPPMTA
jgi:hypothetical protein